MLWSEHRLISYDETPIFYRHREAAEGPAKAVVILVHGMGEHGGRYERLSEYLSAMGIESYAPDLRGFGQSAGKRAYARSITEFHEDLGVLHRYAVRTHKDLPVFLLGHSFGGLIVSSYTAFFKRPDPQGLVLSSPIFGMGVPVAWWRHVLGIAASYLSPEHSENTGVLAEDLTHDPDILEKYSKDTLIYHKISAALYRELCRTIARSRQIASRIKVPIVIVQAGDDKIVSPKATQLFYDHLGSEDREIEIYPDLYHEVFNEIGRDKVFSPVGQWILKRSNHN